MSKLNKNIVTFFSILLGSLWLSASAYAATEDNLQTDIQDLRKAVLQLQADVNKLERDVLFPPLLRTDLYLSVNVNTEDAEEFSIKQMKVLIDNVEAVDYWYGSEQVKALLKGDKQLLWQGNVGFGEHQVKVVYQLLDKRGKSLLGEKSFTFTKNSEQQPLLLKVIYEGGKKPSVSLSPVRQ